MAYRSPYSIPPNKEMIRAYVRRFGAHGMWEEIAEIIGCAKDSVPHKLNHANFADHEKIAIAKEFELTAQEFVDMFYPHYFHADGNVKLDREVKYRDVKERGFDTFPKYW